MRSATSRGAFLDSLDLAWQRRVLAREGSGWDTGTGAWEIGTSYEGPDDEDRSGRSGGYGDCGCSTCGDCAEDPPARRAPTDDGPDWDAPPQERYDGEAGLARVPCPADFNRMDPPLLWALTDEIGLTNVAVDPYTASCFAAEFGIALPPTNGSWSVLLPDVGCCPPFRNVQPCVLPPQPWAALDIRPFSPYSIYRDLEKDTSITYPCDDADEAESIALTEAAISLLRANLDIVEWVLCLIAGYVPRTGFASINANLDTMVQGILQMVKGETPSPEWPNWPNPFVPDFVNAPPPPDWQLTIIGFKLENDVPDGSNAMSIPFTEPDPDGSIGVYVAANTARTLNYRAMLADPDPEVQFCGVAGHAGTMLHELVHVWVKLKGFDISNPKDEYGWHDRTTDTPCWDTARMAKGALLWAFAQRYTCLEYPALNFLTSGGANFITGLSDAYPCAGSMQRTGVFDSYPCPEDVGEFGGGPSPPDFDRDPVIVFESDRDVTYNYAAWGDEVVVFLDGALLL